MTSDTTKQTEAVFGHHMQAIGAKDVDGIMADFADDAVVFVPEGPVRGQAAIREWFTNLVATLTPELMGTFKIERQDIDGEVAFLVWSAGDFVPLATDTFVLKNGKIVVQTFVPFTPRG